ncbi:zinc transporter 1a [Leucoraja erinacea]|uniref:zinc transporter 1a n=1 Tax=Leucoraja erinaceus TaxID=7782 RepID=UPI0024570D23|nr:zinc transporter 1a [Leucoraja erinacea]
MVKMDCEPNRARLMCMLWLTFGFFVVEVVVSRLTSSLAMLSDSFHMLSDVIALVVALIAVRFSAKTQSTAKNTFGWIRAEVMGALVNAVFLTALCFTIVLEAIERFSEPQEIQNAVVVIGVGAAGLLVNLLGLCMFHASGAGGGGGDGGPGAAHGHSHTHVGGSDSRHWLRRKKRSDAEKLAGNGSSVRDQEEINILVNSGSPINCVNADKQDVFSTRRSGDSRLVNDLLRENNMQSLQMNGISILDDHLDEYGDVEDTASQLNMRGVFLHVLGDALGSVIVVVNALIFYFVWNPCPESGPCINLCRHDHCPDRHLNGTQSNMSEYREIIPEAGPCWVLFLDPTLCCIMVCILLYTTYPLLKESALILLQTVPKQIDVQLINEKLRNLEGVLAVHELHVWQLAGSRIIATAHIKCRDPTAYMDVAKRIKDFFHDEGIHATTIQPEFASVNSESRISVCELPCKTQCALKQCCGNGEKSSSDSKLETPSTHSLEVIGESSSECPNVRTERNEMGNNAVKIKDTQYESAV